jgi:hypothetical protein
MAFADNLQPIVYYNTEWAEALDEAIPDFALGAPQAFLLHLGTLPPEPRRTPKTGH